ncbi:MAG: sugar phosphate isomerase/epimerase family protein [Acutalibacteraceae bacterium]
MQNIGFTTVTFRKKSRREVCEIARKNDIKYIEWGGDVHLPPNDPTALNEVISLQNEFGLSAVSYGSYYRLGAEDYALWESITETASKIGAKIIRIWQGDSASENVSNEKLSAMVNETKTLADIAAKKGLTVAFEFHNGTNNDNGKSALEFLKTVGKPNVKTYWQPFSTKDDINNLKAVLPYLVCVHIFEWDEKGKRYSLKHGRKKWTEFFRIIEKSHSNPYMIMEFVKGDSRHRFAKDVKTLARILTEATGI